MSSSNRQPIVFISYCSVDVIDQGAQARVPDPRARELADKLRAQGVDVRLDVYFRQSLYGFKPPQRVPGDSRDLWLAWSDQQIADADAVLMLCTPEYANNDPNHGESPGCWSNWCQLDKASRLRASVPNLWWDWLAMAQDCERRPQKYIPMVMGGYSGDHIPAFVREASSVNLADAGAFDVLMRRIRQVWRERVPREGVFISYAHKDDQSWLSDLLTNLSWLTKYGVKLWTDRDIEAGENWSSSIRSALDCAKIGMLLVSPEFLASPYIINEELPRMLEAAESDGLRIFWIPLRPSAYPRSPIAKFHAAHPPDRPLSSLRRDKRDQAFVDIGEKLAKSLGIGDDIIAGAIPEKSRPKHRRSILITAVATASVALLLLVLTMSKNWRGAERYENTWKFQRHQGQLDWRLPKGWSIEADEHDPQLTINEPTQLMGGPKDFDRRQLSNFILRFLVSLGSDTRPGTKLLWAVRTNPNDLPALPQCPAWFAKICLNHASPSADPLGSRQVAGYQFRLESDSKNLRLVSTVERAPFEPGQLPPGEANLGLPCCLADVELSVTLRVKENTFQHCISLVAPVGQDIPNTGIPQPANFTDSDNLFTSGSFGFIAGISGPVTVHQIEVIPLPREVLLSPSNPNRRYYEKELRCSGL